MLSKIIMRAGRPPMMLLFNKKLPTPLTASFLHTSTPMSGGGDVDVTLNVKPPPRVRPPITWEDPYAFPERDHANFPRQVLDHDSPPPTRLYFIPENWFTFFHEKTGVTGPYMLFFGMGAFAFSKEFYVMEHDFYFGVVFVAFLVTLAKKFGPSVNKWMEGEFAEEKERLMTIAPDEINRCMEVVEDEKVSQEMSASYDKLIQSKRDNIALQLEAVYRERMKEAHQMVKSRLDYQLEVNNVMRRIEQRHMVDWIIDNVKKNITAKQEDDALKKCVADLKELAKATN